MSTSPHHEDWHRASVQGTLGDAAQQEVADATRAARAHDEKIGARRVHGGQQIVRCACGNGGSDAPAGAGEGSFSPCEVFLCPCGPLSVDASTVLMASRRPTRAANQRFERLPERDRRA